MSVVRVPVITLASGQTVKLLKIRLFQENVLLEVCKLKAQAAKALGPNGLGIGVFGTPSWEFAIEAAALGIISSLLAGGAQRTAIEALKAAQEKLATARAEGVLFDCSGIENLGIPNPAAWVVLGPLKEQLTDLSHMSHAEKKAFITKYSDDYHSYHEMQVWLKMPARYVFDNDEFLHVVSESGDMNIRWSQVVTYALEDI